MINRNDILNLNRSKTREWIVVAGLVFFAIFIRWFFIRSNQIYFWFDQTRDAHIARSIIEEKDIKIQGPSASGTGDSVYHGVFYYYFIAPFYSFSGGNPFYPALALIIWNSLSIIPIYILAKDLTSSKVLAAFASLLMVLSITNINISTWLSNPSLAILTISVFYLSLWKLFIRGKRKYLFSLALSIGLSFQSALWLIYLGVPAVLFFLVSQIKLKAYILSWKDYLIAFLILITTISSMILAQFKLYQAGLFNFSVVGGDLSEKRIPLTQFFRQLSDFLINKWSQSLTPGFPQIGFILACVLLILGIHLGWKKKLLIYSVILSPLALILLSSRFTPYLLIQTELGFYLLISILISNLKLTTKQLLLLLSIIIIPFTYLNFKYLQRLRQTKKNDLYIQVGSNLSDQLALVKKTYQIAEGREFTISNWGNPLYYYINWAYLYDYWAEKNNLTKPKFYGPSQIGNVGYGLLEEVAQPSDLHFTILEPEVGAPDWLKQRFLDTQKDLEVVDELEFGSTQIHHREKPKE